MKGFKKNGKFRPTEKRNKSGLSKKNSVDIIQKRSDGHIIGVVEPNTDGSLVKKKSESLGINIPEENVRRSNYGIQNNQSIKKAIKEITLGGRSKQSLDEKENDDLVTGIIRAENGEMDNDELIDFVLKHQDTLMQLQGSWQRTVQDVLADVKRNDEGRYDDPADYYKKTLDKDYQIVSDDRKRSPEDIERIAKLLAELDELESSQYPDHKKTLDDSESIEGKSNSEAQKFMKEYEFEFKKGQAQHYMEISLKRPLTETELKRYKQLAKELGYQG
jgi:hypothetical protein